MTAPRRDLRLMQQQAGELDAQLAAARHTAHSGDRLVTAVVTGQGKLIDLRIEDRALHGAHVQKLGLSIVEAVRGARAAASSSALPQVNALFGKPPPPVAPATTVMSQRRLAEPPPAALPDTAESVYNLAKEIDARVATVEQAAENGEALPLVLNIGTSLGTVTVDGLGGLVSVDRDAVAGQTSASLAREIR